jgi:hypothetical protein
MNLAQAAIDQPALASCRGAAHAVVASTVRPATSSVIARL